jgi:hypothetical protein
VTAFGQIHARLSGRGEGEARASGSDPARRLRAVALLLAALASHPAGAQASLPADAQPGFKYLHFLAGLSLGLSAAQLVESLGAGAPPRGSPWIPPLAAVAAAAVAGVGKEALDSTGFGDPRFSDIVVTTIGGLAASAMIVYADSLYPDTTAGRRNSASFVVSTAVVLAVPVVIGFAREVRRWRERQRAASVARAEPAPAP